MISLVDTNPKKDPMDFSMLNIKEFCADWKASLKDRLDGQGALYIIQVGDNEASTRYVRNKVKDAEEVGLEANVVKLPEDVTQEAAEQHQHQGHPVHDLIHAAVMLGHDFLQKTIHCVVPPVVGFISSYGRNIK